MMVIVENSIWLPWLPPLRLECDARVIDNSVIICIQQNSVKENFRSKQSIIPINIWIYKMRFRKTYSNERALEQLAMLKLIAYGSILPDEWLWLRMPLVVCICDAFCGKFGTKVDSDTIDASNTWHSPVENSKEIMPCGSSACQICPLNISTW